MKVVAPDYYKEFSCTAHKCAHNCCIGWEIDIDSDTFEHYKTVSGDFGERLKKGISVKNDTPHFVLGENERCPFLDTNNLCDIITNLGEDSLCQICSDHPRFRNFFDSRAEIGLGLCCEAAARLILTKEDKTKLITLKNGDDGQEEFFSFRNGLFEITQNREKSIDERVEEMLSACGIKLPQKSVPQWADLYLGLERLDPLWTSMLTELKNKEIPPLSEDIKLSAAFEQLVVYFLYRHLPEGIYDGRIRERAAFSALSLYIIRSLLALSGDWSIDNLIEIARMYSAEIEYSEENLYEILRFF